MTNGTDRTADSKGNPVFDPTRNVAALVDAEGERQDGLRLAEARYNTEVQRHSELVAELRATHYRDLRTLESQRIDAIREVDTQNVSRAAEVAAAQADALRGQVEAARIAVADTLSTALDPIQKDIQELRKIQYEQQGQKSGMSDPVLLEIRALREEQATRAGRDSRDTLTEGRSYASGVQTRYLGTYAAISLVLIIVAGVVGHFLH